MKLSNPENREIAPRFILAMVDRDSPGADVREEQLMRTCPDVQTGQFTYTKESAWRIVDTILDSDIPPTELCHVQDELDRICGPLPKQFPMRKKRFLEALEVLGICKFLMIIPFSYRVINYS